MILHYHLWGPQTPENSKLVLLHGMGGTAALWRPIAAMLEDEFSIMAFDQRGHGKSVIRSGADAYSPTDFGIDVVETMRAAQFGPAWIVGHSMGVRTACAVAHLAPELVRGLVLVDLGFQGGAGGKMNENLKSFLTKLPERFESREQARTFMNQESPDPAIAQYLMAVSVRGASGEITFPFDRAALLKTLEQANASDLRPWIREFAKTDKAVLVLRGATSRVLSQAEFEAEKVRFADLPSVTFKEIEGAGHGLPFEKRKEFVAELVALIRES